jgi:3-isopropylmalate/(R)-2-methylmalate dehydratase large subunit
MSMSKLKVRRINVTGKLRPGVYAKDVILAIINKLGVNGGVGYAYEYAGPVISAMSMEERMTLCNMSIEGGARIGYVNPDETTFAYLKGRRFSPKGADWDKALAYWKSIASDADAEFDDVVEIDGSALEPFVTWGITPGQSIPVSRGIPAVASFPADERPLVQEALEYMSLSEGQPIAGVPIDVVFIGSCTNGRLSDLEEVAKLVKGRKVNPKVKALVVPGSQDVQRQAVAKGLPQIFTDAGFQWREPGCSMCLAMNPDKLQGRQICASTSNRNFKGRQGSASGRTLLMSPAMAAAAAIEGKVADARSVFAMAGA